MQLAAASNGEHTCSAESAAPELAFSHLRVHLQLLHAALEQLAAVLRAQLDEVAGVERQTLVVGARQLPRKRQLVCNGRIIRQMLQLVLGAPGEQVAGQPARMRANSFDSLISLHYPGSLTNASRKKPTLEVQAPALCPRTVSTLYTCRTTAASSQGRLCRIAVFPACLHASGSGQHP